MSGFSVICWSNNNCKCDKKRSIHSFFCPAIFLLHRRQLLSPLWQSRWSDLSDSVTYGSWVVALFWLHSSSPFVPPTSARGCFWGQPFPLIQQRAAFLCACHFCTLTQKMDIFWETCAQQENTYNSWKTEISKERMKCWRYALPGEEMAEGRPDRALQISNRPDI